MKLRISRKEIEKHWAKVWKDEQLNDQAHPPRARRRIHHVSSFCLDLRALPFNPKRDPVTPFFLTRITEATHQTEQQRSLVANVAARLSTRSISPNEREESERRSSLFSIARSLHAGFARKLTVLQWKWPDFINETAGRGPFF